MNRFAATISSADFLEEAVGEVCEPIVEALASPPDLLFVAATASYAEEADALLGRLHEELAPRVLIGAVSADGVLGSGIELEAGPGLSVWAACLPEAEIEPFHALYGGPSVPAMLGWPEERRGTTRLVLGDSATFPMDTLVEHRPHDDDGSTWLGGTIGGSAVGKARLLIGETVATRGAVGVTIAGTPVTPLVAHGALPIGPELVVTAAKGDLILELAGRPAVSRLQDLLDLYPERERPLVIRSLVLGLVIDQNVPRYSLGDYLLRPVFADPREPGAIRIDGRPRVGQTVRFHVRDHGTAARDLDAVLETARESLGSTVGGALMFACAARGSNIFAPRNDDAHRLRVGLGVPTAGMFCETEIGPVGSRTVVHELSATIAVFGRD